MFSKIHLPRATGDVRLATEVTRRKLDCPSRPAAGVVLNRNAAELAAVNARHSIMRRQALVDERVVGIQQIYHVAILPHDALKQQLSLAAEGLAQILVKFAATADADSSALANTATGPAKLVASVSERGSASMRRVWRSSTAGSCSLF